MKITRIDTRLKSAQKSVVVRVRTGSGPEGGSNVDLSPGYSEAMPDEIRGDPGPPGARSDRTRHGEHSWRAGRDGSCRP
jgi:hypothetical protein